MIGGGGGIGGGSGDILGVLGSSVIGHISNISIITIGGVGDMLDSAVGKSNRVGALGIAGTIGGLLSIEVGLGVVISHSVGEGVGRDLIGVFLGLVSGGGLVSNRGRGISGGSLHNHGGNDGGSVDGVGDNRGMVDHWVDGVVSNWVDGVVSNWVNSMVSHWVDGVMDWGVDSVSEMRGVRGVRGKHDTSVADMSVAAHIRGGGSSSQTEQGGNDESLK